ncbi:MAG: guanylate kinase [Alphaproteobacteria bacterium]
MIGRRASRIGRRGLLLVLSSPSGAGKTTITRRLLERDAGLILSVSVTTRVPRPSEIDGRDYWFTDQRRFTEMVIKNELLEHATVFGNRYGTPREPIETALGAGRDVITDIDWQGTQQLKETVRDDIATVFVLPPDLPTLEKRLRARAEDSDDAIAERMSKASDEMSHWPEYNYVVINDNLDQCVSEVEAILTAERSRRTRQIGLADFVNKIRDELTEQSSELRKRARKRTKIRN